MVMILVGKLEMLFLLLFAGAEGSTGVAAGELNVGIVQDAED